MRIFLTIILTLFFYSCTTISYTTRVVDKKKLLFWDVYTLQQLCSDEFNIDYDPINRYFKLITRSDTIDKIDYYIYTKKTL